MFHKEDKRKMKGMLIKPHTNNYGEQKNYVSTADDNLCYPLSIINIPQLRGNSKEKLPHATQKPIALAEYFITTYSNEGDVVLDNCVGSGTTIEACINTNRQYIAMEKKPFNYDMATERVAKCKANFQPTLFTQRAAYLSPTNSMSYDSFNNKGK